MRADLGNPSAAAARAPTCSRDYFFGAEAASRFRPLARLRLSTARPATVELRLRKPWVRFLRSFEGWYVRLGKVLLRPFGRPRALTQRSATSQRGSGESPRDPD